MALCSACGKPVPEGQGFCSVCGARVGAAPPAQPIPPLPRKKGPNVGLIIALSVAGVFAVIIIIGIISIIAIPSLLESKRAAQTQAAMSMLRNISSAEVAYSSKSSNEMSYGSLEDLSTQGFLDSRFQSGTGHFDGYTFTLEASKDKFKAQAVPDDENKPTFLIDETGVIRYSNGQPVGG